MDVGQPVPEYLLDLHYLAGAGVLVDELASNTYWSGSMPIEFRVCTGPWLAHYGR